MRDGFNFQGVESTARFGSFGRKEQLAARRRAASGCFFAGQVIDDDGFRDFSEADIRRVYADLGVKNAGVELHLNFTGPQPGGRDSRGARQFLDLGGPEPSRRRRSPTTASMVSLNGSVKATPTLTFSGVGYPRWFHKSTSTATSPRSAKMRSYRIRKRGNFWHGQPYPGGQNNRALCFGDDDAENVVRDQNGKAILVPGVGGVVGNTVLGVPSPLLARSIARARTPTASAASVQGVDKTPIAGMPNQFLLGTSYDHGSVAYTASSELGYFGPLLAW